MRKHSASIIGLALLMSVATPASARAKRQAPRSLCANIPYPGALDLDRIYQISTVLRNSEGTPVVQSMSPAIEEITSAEGNAFSVRTSIYDTTIDTSWTCTPEGIVLKYDPSFTVEGINYPAVLKVGGAWQQTVSVKQENGLTVTTSRYEVSRKEKVEVPAGKFEAMKIDFHNVTVSPSGEVIQKIDGSQWIAPKAGLVKSFSTTEIGSGKDKGFTDIGTELHASSRKK